MSDDLVKRARHNVLADMPHYASVELIEAMADRIEELEAKLARYDEVVGDKINLRSENEELKAELAKAVEALRFYGTLIGETHECPWHMLSDDFGEKARTALADLTGGKDDNS